MFRYEIPLDIQEEIMKRLPVKSLIQFRSVSKEWKSLIDSSHFIAAHSLRRYTQRQHLLVSHEDPGKWRKNLAEVNKYVCYIDDETFPQQRAVLTLPPSINPLYLARVVGSSHGLLCLQGADPNLGKEVAVLCNPLIRKSIVVALPTNRDQWPEVSFGVCPVTSDPKIVSITRSSDDPNSEPKIIVITRSSDDPTIKISYRFEDMVYTLSSGKWRSLSTNLPAERLQYVLYAAVTDRFIYWRAFSLTHLMIFSFDLTNENIERIDLPDGLAQLDYNCLYFSTLRESLAICDYKGNICTVWMLEHGVQKSFTKLFTISHDFILGFRRSGIPIVKESDGGPDYDEFQLVVYEPKSVDNFVLESSRFPWTFNVHSYVETLVLLGRSDCSGYFFFFFLTS